MNQRYNGLSVTWWLVLLSSIAVIASGFLQLWVMETYNADLFSSMSVSQILLLLPLILGIIYLKRMHPYASAASLMGVRSFEPTLMLLMILMPAAAQFFATLIQFPYIEALTEIFGEQISFEDTPSTIAELLWLFLAICIVAPVLEELIFRGVIMKILDPYGSLASIMISSICFSLLHFSPVVLITIFIVGIVLGFIRIYTDSIFPCMLFHSMFNFTSLIMLVFEKELERFEIAFGIYSIVMAVLFPLLFFIMYKTCGKGKWYKGTVHKLRGGVFPMILTLVIYALMAVSLMIASGTVSFDYGVIPEEAPIEEELVPETPYGEDYYSYGDDFFGDDFFGFDMFEEFDSFFNDNFEGGAFSQ